MHNYFRSSNKNVSVLSDNFILHFLMGFIMKGIILAGGSGTRLYPSTLSLSKQLLTIYDKPMIYYSLSTLLLAGIRDILIVSTKRDLPIYEELFKDGSDLGVKFNYIVQKKPEGLAQAFILGENFIGKDNVCLVLGDNIFYGYGFTRRLENAAKRIRGATIFGYHVSNPEDFGIVEFDSSGKVVSLQEKPKNPKSNYAVPGLYFYDNNVIKIAKSVKPSKRGELEITSVNEVYLKEGLLNVELFGRGMAWLDTGTHQSMLAAANFVETLQNRQGLYVACIEEISYKKGFIGKDLLLKKAVQLRNSDYGKYLYKIYESG